MTREYASENIVVLWDAERCVHEGNCVRGLPEVFSHAMRPWVNPTAAEANAIADLIRTCPSGALHFRRLDGGTEEAPAAPNSVHVVPNGPLYARGDLEVCAPDGEVMRRDTRMALCRCGGSANKPFCDNSHRTNGFVG